ncbi:ATP-binding cassette domain-containing protein [Cohnella hongkongensis]|uniref:ATP-binding cassette domain-containing protein n=1 Tax=Cohnella hongkongensis TaxID=178337 RepID=A0ABV9FKG8_9BACL
MVKASDNAKESTPLVKLVEIDRIYAGKAALEKLSLSIGAGEVVALLGRNGSGKSTLLKAISGLGALDAGKRLARVPLKRIGFAPDRFPKLRFTAEEYLRAMGSIRGMKAEALERRIADLMETFRLPNGKGRLDTFSKGMLQKVNLMQALLEEPDLLLLDEPLSGLDTGTQEELMQTLARLNSGGMAIVFSTHEPELVDRLADRVVMLENGKVESISAPRSRTSKACVAIVFTLDDETAETVFGAAEGVLLTYKERGMWAVHIEAGRSDRFLGSVLAAGGSIRSVAEANREDERI